MSKVTMKLKIEINEEDFKSIEYASLLYYLNATPITESDDVVSREEVCNIANDIKDYCVSMYNPNDASEAEIINYIYKYVDALYDLPSVTPKREQGEWIEVHPLQEDDGGAYMCSKCRCGHPCIDPDYWKYCPNCGTEMR